MTLYLYNKVFGRVTVFLLVHRTINYQINTSINLLSMPCTSNQNIKFIYCIKAVWFWSILKYRGYCQLVNIWHIIFNIHTHFVHLIFINPAFKYLLILSWLYYYMIVYNGNDFILPYNTMSISISITSSSKSTTNSISFFYL